MAAYAPPGHSVLNACVKLSGSVKIIFVNANNVTINDFDAFDFFDIVQGKTFFFFTRWSMFI